MGGLEIGWEHDQENNMKETTHNLVPAPADRRPSFRVKKSD